MPSENSCAALRFVCCLVHSFGGPAGRAAGPFRGCSELGLGSRQDHTNVNRERSVFVLCGPRAQLGSGVMERLRPLTYMKFRLLRCPPIDRRIDHLYPTSRAYCSGVSRRSTFPRPAMMARSTACLEARSRNPFPRRIISTSLCIVGL